MGDAVNSNLPCDDCGSSRGRTEYADGWSHCFKCGTHKRWSDDAEDQPTTSEKYKNGSKKIGKDRPLLTSIDFSAGVPERGLTEETCRKWQYGWATTERGNLVQVAQFRNAAGTHTAAQKLRSDDKKFAWTGERDDIEPLFGMHLWQTKGKMVVITEGEIDAMSVSQLQQNKWPVVSLMDGCQSAEKGLKAALEWLDGFERVILMFDMDKPGRDAVEVAAGILPVGKAFIADLPLKDANECLTKGRGAEVITALWNARPWRPDAVLDGDEVLKLLMDYKGPQGVPMRWPELAKLVPLLPTKAITTLVAGTGSGKTTIVKHMEAHLIAEGERVAMFHLEEDVAETALGIMGAANRTSVEKLLKMAKADMVDLYKATAGRPGVFYYDSFGSIDPEVIIRKIRYLVKAEEVRYVVLDHLSIVMSGLAISNERKAIDVVMTQLRSLVEELKIGLVIINHLTRDKGRSHEEGDAVRLNDIRGSQAIAQLSDVVIALERNQQEEDIYKRNLITVRVLKNRPFRKLGVACKLYYEDATGDLIDFPPNHMDDERDEFDAISPEEPDKPKGDLAPSDEAPF